MTTRQAPVLLLLIAGFVLWSSALLVLYSALTVGCALGWEKIAVGPLSVQRTMLLLIWIVHIAAICMIFIWLVRRQRSSTGRSTPDFLIQASYGSTTSALAATLWTGGPILFTSMCR